MRFIALQLGEIFVAVFVGCFQKYTIAVSIDIKDPPPIVFFMVVLHKSILGYNKIPLSSENGKNGDVPRGNFSNHFMIIIVFIQLHCSKSTTL